MIDKYSLGYKFANFLAQKFLGLKTPCAYFSTKQRASCLIKVVFMYNEKVLLAKKIQSDSLSKVSLPYAYVDLDGFESNSKACVSLAFDKMNITLDEIDFDKRALLDVKIDYEDDLAQIVYVYKYSLLDQEYSRISSTYRFYDFFLLDFDDLSEYNKKERFVTDLDYVILKKLKKEVCSGK